MSGSETDDPTADAESTTEDGLAEFVEASSTRTAVLTQLVDGPSTPSEIADNRSVTIDGDTASTASTSATTAKTAAEQLQDKEMVEVFETEDLRVYSLTALGESVLYTIKEKDKD